MYGITAKHQVVIDLPESDRLLSLPSHTISTDVNSYTIVTRVFGSPDTRSYMVKYSAGINMLTKAVERLFLNETSCTGMLEKSNIPQLAASLVSFSSDKALWERSANVKVIASESQQSQGTVEADLMHLARDFGACLAVNVLYGADLLKRNLELLDDLWRFDNDAFILLVLGVPTWAPISLLRKGLEARSRLHKALEGVYKRTDQYLNQQQVDFGADMSDISACVKGRYETYNEYDYTMSERGQLDLSLLWAANANTQPLVFWFLVYAYATPGLKEELRKEHTPYLTFADTDKPDLTAMDISGLTRECSLTKSCLFEVYRLANEVTSLRYVHKPMNIKDGARTHAIPAGTFLSVAHNLRQRDAAVYEDPDAFKPDRFLETDEETGKRSARYGKLKPWGAGSGICKGRTFAEKEIITLCAAILAVWDIVPAKGEWKIPDMIPGTGATRPAEDIRVRITRRERK